MNPEHSGGESGHALPWPPPAGQQPVPGQPLRRRGSSWGTVVVGVVGIAALVVAIIALAKASSQSSVASPPLGSSSASPAPTRAGDTSTADRALCEAIAPLMAESDSATTAYINTGTSQSPERIAATPKYVTATQDWASRIQPVIDDHPDVDPYLKRTLQRFVDDMRLYVTDLDAGPSLSYDDTVYADSMAAYNGPLRTCWDLGVKW
ncbi:hypothetical protein [Mycobacterium marinum]|uniref:hypothetical protein n=1 Tax=Mycobacterium marinum TaxID=1781 RepID=UPI00356AE2DF